MIKHVTARCFVCCISLVFLYVLSAALYYVYTVQGSKLTNGLTNGLVFLTPSNIKTRLGSLSKQLLREMDHTATKLQSSTLSRPFPYICLHSLDLYGILVSVFEMFCFHYFSKPLHFPNLKKCICS